MKFDKLFKQDFKIVESKKTVILVPIIILAIAIICGTIYGFIFGNPFNLGMDFTGGYKVNITLGNKLTDDNYQTYYDLAESIAENLKDENGKPYGIEISSVQRQGESDTAGILLKYKAVASVDKMAEINEQLRDELIDAIFVSKPTVTIAGDGLSFVAQYGSDVMLDGDYENVRKDALINAGYDVTTVAKDEEAKKITVTLGSAVNAEKLSEITSIMTIEDPFGGQVVDGGQTSSTVSDETLKSTLLAVSVAMLCMLIYIVIRFELLSGLSAIIALAHDLIIMLCGMVIFRIEINSTFIAALITILGYSINNTIIIFDRVRENMKLLNGKRINGKLVKPAYIANKSVQETVWRSINTTLTTLITIGMVALIGVADIKIFALPIIFGLLAGTYSSVFIAPMVWAELMKVFPGKYKIPKAKSTANADKK